MATTKTKTEKIIEDITYASSNQSISRRVIYEFKNLKEVRTFFNDPMSQLSKHIFSKSLYKNYYWSYEKLSNYPITKTIKKRIHAFID